MWACSGLWLVERMKPDAGGHIEVHVGVVDRVQAPQDRDGMDHHVLEVDGEVEESHGHNTAGQEGMATL